MIKTRDKWNIPLMETIACDTIIEMFAKKSSKFPMSYN